MTSYFNIICPEDRQLQPKPHDLDSSYAAAVGLWRPALRKAVSVVSHAPLQCRRAQTTAMLGACTVMFPACKQNCTRNRHSLFLRWEKDNTAIEQKSSFSGLLQWGSICLCHRKLRYQQVLPGSSSKTTFCKHCHSGLHDMHFILSSPNKHQNFLSFHLKDQKPLQSESANQTE